MNIMSVEVLDGIREKCETTRYYKACIFCEDRARARVIQETLISAWPAIYGTSSIYRFDVMFPQTNSIVRILTYGEVSTGASRGNKFHEICIDALADHLTAQVRDELNHMVIPNYRFVESEQRGYHSGNLIIDDVIWEASVDNEAWTITFENGSKISAINKKAPDFGEISPSQELRSYLNDLKLDVKGA